MVTRLFIYAQTQVAHVNPQGSQLREEERAGSPKDFKAFSEEGHMTHWSHQRACCVDQFKFHQCFEHCSMNTLSVNPWDFLESPAALCSVISLWLSCRKETRNSFY